MWRPCEYCGKWQTGRLCRADRRRLREARKALAPYRPQPESLARLLPWRLIAEIDRARSVSVIFPIRALAIEVLILVVLALGLLCVL